MPSSLETFAMTRIYPVILSGGVGSRLWPVSRAAAPKQLLPLVGERSLLQETILRTQVDRGMLPPVIICNDAHRFIIAAQLQELGTKPTDHILEPVGRNTAAAAAVAALVLSAMDRDAILVLLPADHFIADKGAFSRALEDAMPFATAGNIVTLGILPTGPKTGYGYIKKGLPLGDGCFALERFYEKPNRETAEGFIAEGDYLWNAGVFIASAQTLLTEMRLHCPSIILSATEALRAAKLDLDFLRLDAEAFAACPSEPFDIAVMERTDKGVVIPLDCGWSDVGSWSTLWDLGSKDADGNVTVGDVLAINTSNSYVRSEGRLVATLGIDDLIIVETGDAVLVAAKREAQNISAVVTRLISLGREEAQSHARVHRPWGFYELVETGERFQVKHLMVKPGAALSLQMHHHRAEHWVVVRGTARVTINGTSTLLAENESTFIPIGTKHRLENPGKVPLSIIEVQSGAYLGEDDIVRFDDHYGRTHN